MNVRRTLVKHDKRNGGLLAEYELHGIDLNELQFLFGETVDDQMFYTYDVTEVQKARLEKAARVKINLDNFDYCIDASTLPPGLD